MKCECQKIKIPKSLGFGNSFQQNGSRSEKRGENVPFFALSYLYSVAIVGRVGRLHRELGDLGEVVHLDRGREGPAHRLSQEGFKD